MSSASRDVAATSAGGVLVDRTQRRIVVVAMLAAIALDSAAAPLTAPAFAVAAAALRVSEALAAWNQVAFDIGYFVAIVLSLRAMAMLGKRAYFVGSLLTYALASFGCAFAPGGEALVAARFVACIGLGGCFTSALLTIVGASPKSDLPRAMTALSLVLLLAPTLAPLLAATLIVTFSWHAVLIVVALAAIAVALVVARVMEDVRAPERTPIDAASLVALVIAVGAFHLATTPALAGGAIVGNGAIVVALGAAAIFAWRERRASRVPLLDLRVVEMPVIAIGLGVALPLGMLVQGAGFVAQFARGELHLDAMVVGSAIAARALGVVVGVIVMTLATRRGIGASATIATGLALVAVTSLAEAFASSANSGLPTHVAIGIAQACALAIVIGPLAATLFGAVERARFASLAVLFKLAILVGGSIALGVASAWFAFTPAAVDARDRYGDLWFVAAAVAFASAMLAVRLPNATRP